MKYLLETFQMSANKIHFCYFFASSGHFFMLLLTCAAFFQNDFFFPKNFTNTFRVSNSLDPDQDPHPVGLDLGRNWLQRLTADNKGCCKQGNS